ncbi:MAG TPA: dihydroorotate dehydrogenase electron transfer subunit, partial [Bacteroidota bacterium]
MFPVLSNEKVASDIYVVRFHAPQIARTTNPGQFVNIKVDQSYSPFLRRPFSVYDVDGDDVDIVFNVVGRGTAILSSKRPDELLDVIGPLGRPFLADDDYSTAVIVAGGLGVAPFPLLTRFLKKEDKKIVTFLGSRTGSMLVPQRLVNARLATL